MDTKVVRAIGLLGAIAVGWIMLNAEGAHNPDVTYSNNVKRMWKEGIRESKTVCTVIPITSNRPDD